MGVYFYNRLLRDGRSWFFDFNIDLNLYGFMKVIFRTLACLLFALDAYAECKHGFMDEHMKDYKGEEICTLILPPVLFPEGCVIIEGNVVKNYCDHTIAVKIDMDTFKLKQVPIESKPPEDGNYIATVPSRDKTTFKDLRDESHL